MELKIYNVFYSNLFSICHYHLCHQFQSKKIHPNDRPLTRMKRSLNHNDAQKRTTENDECHQEPQT